MDEEAMTAHATQQSIQGRRNKAVGEAAEQLVLIHLQQLGIPAVQIMTGWRVRRAGKRIVGATPMRPVIADIVGCLPDCRMVLIEVKMESSGRLTWSRIQPHQRDNLDKWSTAGALCLIGWVRPGHGLLLIPWGSAPGWGNHHALPWESAQALAWHPAQSLSATKVTP